MLRMLPLSASCRPLVTENHLGRPSSAITARDPRDKWPALYPAVEAQTWSFDQTATHIATSSSPTILVLSRPYDTVYPKANDGRTVDKLTAKDVPADGFW